MTATCNARGHIYAPEREVPSCIRCGMPRWRYRNLTAAERWEVVLAWHEAGRPGTISDALMKAARV